MKVEDISIPLVDIDQFREFDKLIQPPFRSGVHGSSRAPDMRGKVVTKASRASETP